MPTSFHPHCRKTRLRTGTPRGCHAELADIRRSPALRFHQNPKPPADGQATAQTLPAVPQPILPPSFRPQRNE